MLLKWTCIKQEHCESKAFSQMKGYVLAQTKVQGKVKCSKAYIYTWLDGHINVIQDKKHVSV